MDSLFPSAVRTPAVGLHLNTTSLKAVSNTDALSTQSHIYMLKNVVSISELFFAASFQDLVSLVLQGPYLGFN